MPKLAYRAFLLDNFLRFEIEKVYINDSADFRDSKRKHCR